MVPPFLAEKEWCESKFAEGTAQMASNDRSPTLGGEAGVAAASKKR
jgi:hypothetical protein